MPIEVVARKKITILFIFHATQTRNASMSRSNREEDEEEFHWEGTYIQREVNQVHWWLSSRKVCFLGFSKSNEP
jgi:hypothetical protein